MNGCKMGGDLNHFRKCFQPRQWFADEGDPAFINEEDVFMWVYRKVTDERGVETFHVGYFLPDKTWFTESTYATSDDASQRVNYLNGGKR